MSYTVLARKWRPRTFATLIGQDHVVRALTHALDSGRLHHAWLFTGTRGVGKTTLARILAKALNCEQGVGSQPCGQCQACTEIDAGRYIDYIELDAASNRGVDEMTQLLEQAVYAPSVGRFKVYMIDEVHMLTGHSFNAMLKTLEEPPAHVKFVLATTDPQKIPVTVLSRCLQFNLKQMTVPAITAHLQDILAQESIAAEPAALNLIAQAAAGSMRDALSLADQAISFTAGRLDAQAVGEMLGTLDQDQLIKLLQAVAAGNVQEILALADDLLARGMSFQAALADMAGLLTRIAIAQRLGRAQADDAQGAAIEVLASAMTPDQAQLFYAVAVHSRAELSLAPDEYAGFVMACLRMLALLPEGTQPDAGTAGQAPAAAATAASTAAQPPVAQQKPIQQAPVQQAPAQNEPVQQAPVQQKPVQHEPAQRAQAEDLTPATTVQPQAGSPSQTAEQPVPAEPSDMQTARPSAAKADIVAVDAQSWPALVNSLTLSGAALALAQNSQWLGLEQEHIRLRVGIKTLSGRDASKRLQAAINKYFGTALKLVIEHGDTGQETTRAADQARAEQRLQLAQQAAAQDPLVQELQQQLDAQIVPGSVRVPDQAN